ncbi:YcxB family protein [Actinokineospora soli]|uniref:YcxB family protein n=1 Tax=Actinokineospora soli TaxID=1048753 RepID=A0ABW2TT33_9PSEU
MRLQWRPEPADWADAVRTMVPFTRWTPWFAAALGAFSLVLVVIGQPVPGVFGVVCAVLIAALPGVGARVAFTRDPIAGRAVTAEVDEERIRLMTVDGTAHSDLRVADLAGWAETERNFVLRTAGGGVHPVPGRAFGSTEDIDAFRDLLSKALGRPA